MKTDKRERKELLEAKLDNWKDKVLATFESDGVSNTLRMIEDVDNIIAEAFDHDPVLNNN